jgi:hypothetical protein
MPEAAGGLGAAPAPITSAPSRSRTSRERACPERKRPRAGWARQLADREHGVDLIRV